MPSNLLSSLKDCARDEAGGFMNVMNSTTLADYNAKTTTELLQNLKPSLIALFWDFNHSGHAAYNYGKQLVFATGTCAPHKAVLK